MQSSSAPTSSTTTAAACRAGADAQPARGSDATRPAAAMTLEDAALRHVDIGHSQIAYRRLGSGPDVLFVHGWPLHMATFRDVAPLLADRFTCHLVDLPGVGRTRSDDDAPISLRAHADSLRRFVDAIGLERYAIIAHDSGGAVARLLAADDARVSALVLGNTEISGHHTPLVAALALLCRVPGMRALLFSALLGPLRRTRFGFGGCFDDRARLDGQFGALFIDAMREQRAVRDGQMRLLETFDWSVVDQLAAVHRRIEAPTRLVWGRRDGFFPLSKAKAMLDEFRGGADLVEIDGKVFAHEEYPQAFAEAAAQLLVTAA